jgi:hypothetical protein
MRVLASADATRRLRTEIEHRESAEADTVTAENTAGWVECEARRKAAKPPRRPHLEWDGV